jgi:6-pyruvoyltetrahydropterin/6-carboxytetrahydropterin synthase
MVWIISKQFTFEAAHRLPHHDGKCQRLHGHSWVGIAYLQSDRLRETGSNQGMVQDFGDVKTILTPLVNEYLDHHYLNETTGLENPTCEELARWIYDKLKPQLPMLSGIEVKETCTSSCLYTLQPEREINWMYE